jgi:hypothetical protein
MSIKVKSGNCANSSGCSFAFEGIEAPAYVSSSLIAPNNAQAFFQKKLFLYLFAGLKHAAWRLI